jgi:hypothetical protein
LPVVPRELDWVRLEQRFPVRIKLSKNVPAGFLRIGSSMESNDLNPLERFIAKREFELRHKAVAPLARPAPLFVSAPVPAAVKYPGIGRFAYAGGHLGRVALSYVLAFLAALYEMSRETLMSAVTFMASGTAFALTFGRLQNLGKSLWCLGIWLNLPAPALTHHRRQNHTRWRKSGPTAPAPRLAGPPWAC